MIDLRTLNLPRLPARLDVRQAAEVLGFMEYEVPALIRAKLLKPLGAPAPNGHKFFAAVEILTLSQDVQWLDRATKTVSRHWHNKAKRPSLHVNAA